MKRSVLSVMLSVAYAISLMFIGGYVALRLRGGGESSLAELVESSRAPQNKIGYVANYIQNMYVDSLDFDEFQDSAIPAILEELDPHSAYIPKKELVGISEEMKGKFGGIGVQFSLQNDTVMVVDVVSGGPSMRLGVLPGDRIVMVNDSTITGEDVDNDQVLSRLKGEIGSMVKVGVHRRGFEDIIDFEIERGEIELHSVDVAYLITPNTGYIKINRFAENTYDEFYNAVELFDEQGAGNIIVDLRNNSGGYLGIVIQMVDEVLKEGQLIVYTEGDYSPRRTSYASDSGIVQDKRIAVLINEYSASASEIFAGAIQDNDRGIIIGRRSFGKGLVQEQIPFYDGSALRLTTARYYTPAGRCIQKSYENGRKDYALDILNRAKHNEFVSKDSIMFNDSLKFTTLSGRTVYGGGGIMPDIFVPSDTTWYSNYYGKLAGKGVTYYFAFEYADENRDKLSSFSSVEELNDYLIESNVFDQFVKYAEKKGVKRDNGGLKQSRKVLDTQIRSSIARNILGDVAYYKLFFDIDDVLSIAVDNIESEDFELPNGDR